MGTISIEGIDKALLLSKLYNNYIDTQKTKYSNAEFQLDKTYLTEEQARIYINNREDKLNLVFNKIGDSFIGLNISGDVLDTTIYNNKRGIKTAETIIGEIRTSMKNVLLTKTDQITINQELIEIMSEKFLVKIIDEAVMDKKSVEEKELNGWIQINEDSN